MTPSIVRKSELALILSVTKSRISQLVLAGLPVREDGRIDLAPALDWLEKNAAPGRDPASGVHAGARRASNAKSKRVPKPRAEAAVPVEIVAHDGESEMDAARRIMADGGAPFSRAEADRRAANYAAFSAQLRYDLEVGKVAPVAAMAEVFGAQCAIVRNRMLALPAESAPILHRCKTPAELQAKLYDLIYDALRELSEDAPARVTRSTPVAEPARKQTRKGARK